jgi:hypothetical protein
MEDVDDDSDEEEPPDVGPSVEGGVAVEGPFVYQ